MIKSAVVAKDTNKFYDIVDRELRPIKDNEFIVETKAVALNPADYKSVARLPVGWPAGSDAAGVVIEVGKDVKGYKEGDYVASAVFSHDDQSGAFRTKYIGRSDDSINVTQLIKNTTPLSPGEHQSSGISTFEAAASVPCGLVTAAHIFNVSLKVKLDKEANKGKYILIWGGASASGIIAIQLAKAAYGLNVITTASSNSDLLKSLGADHVVNYRESDAVEQIKKLANGSIAYALDTIGTTETFQATYDATVGSETIAIDNLTVQQPQSIKIDETRNIRFVTTFGYLGLGYELRGLKPTAELIGEYQQFWFDILPPYIASLKTANLKVLEPGLESINEGLKLVKEGKVHGTKVVTSL